MKAILLAAGFGSRLAPLTHTVPKCLVSIGSVPLINYWLQQLVDFGITEILINLHYLANEMREHLEHSKWKKHLTIIYEPELLGPGGTIIANESFINEESFLVAHADNLTYIDMEKFIAAHSNRPSDVVITMMTFTTETPHSCGIVELDADNRVRKFHEKVENPPGNLANGAVFIMEPLVLECLRTSTFPMDISCHILPQFLGKMQIWHNDHYLRDIGTPESLEQANKDVHTHPMLKQLNKQLRYEI